MSDVLESREREFLLLARLFQEELGRLPCAFVRYTESGVTMDIVLTKT